MSGSQNLGDTGSISTVQSTASVFESLLSAEEAEDNQDSETPEEGDGEPTEQLDDADESEEVVEGDDEPAEEDEDAPVARVRKLKVKIDGQESELPEDEVVKGYQRGADYTRKTQDLAAKTKAFEAEQVSVRGERQQYATQLTQLADALKNMTPAEPDWDTLRNEDPAEFAATWASWQRHKQQMEKVDQTRRQAIDAVTKDQVEQLKQHLESENAKLLEAIPHWKDAAVATKEKSELNKYAQSLGYTEQELNQVYDHRVMNVLRKAMLFDKAEKAKPAVRAKIDAVKAATPGPANNPNRQPVSAQQKAQQRFVKSGKVQDAAPVFEKFL
jgi:hypothetical protein